MNTFIFQATVDCPQCAKEAEAEIQKNKDINSASFDFISKKLTITSSLTRAEVLNIIKKSSDEIVIMDSDNEYIFTATIDCPGCAKEAETAILKNPNIKSCTFDFMNKKLTITSPLSKEEVLDIIRKSSDEIKIEENSSKYNELVIDATVDCADCAKKIERALINNSFVEKADFDFMKKKLYVTTALQESEVKALARKADDDIVFIDKTREKEKRDEIIIWSRIASSILLVILSKVIAIPYIAIVGYLIIGYDVLIKAVKNILKGKAMDENFLMAIATIGALFLGTFEEAAAVMIFYQVGETLQQKSVNNSRRSISELMDIKADVAHLVKDGEGVDVPPSTVQIGDIIRIKSGEKIPLDGIIIKGKSDIDYKALNGESKPAFVEENDSILSGGINGKGTLEIKVTTNYEGSTVKKILSLMESAKNKKTKSEAFISVFSKYYTPIVCFLALLISFVPPLLGFGSLSTWLYQGLTLLVISCPCALVISIPLSYFSATGAFAKKGVLIKNSSVIQSLSKTDAICFDKTGTLTKGEFEIVKIDTKLEKDEAIKIAASLENGSTHPIARAIIENNKEESYQVEALTEISGIGIKGKINNDEYSLGNSKLLNKEIQNNSIYTTSYLLKNGELIATFYFGDIIKPEAKESIKVLHNLGVKNLTMLSGDKKEVAKKVAEDLNLDSYYAELMPGDKIDEFEKIQKNSTITAYVGDGINDSPVLMRADVGISMGGVGSDAAIEASDMVIMSDDLSRLPSAIKLSRKTQAIVKQNIYFSIGIKVIIMVLSLFGLGNMWLAIFADVGVSLLATMNAMRTMLSKK